LATVESIEYVIIGYSGDEFCAQIAPALADLTARGTHRLLDMVFIDKDDVGDVVMRRPDELDVPPPPGLAALDTLIDTSVDRLVTDVDAIYAAEELAPDSTAALIAWEPPRRHAAPQSGINGRATPAGPIPHDIVRLGVADLVTARARSCSPTGSAVCSAAPVGASRACRPPRPPRHGSGPAVCGRGPSSRP
jgi:hypothetical protein